MTTSVVRWSIAAATARQHSGSKQQFGRLHATTESKASIERDRQPPTAEDRDRRSREASLNRRACAIATGSGSVSRRQSALTGWGVLSIPPHPPLTAHSFFSFSFFFARAPAILSPPHPPLGRSFHIAYAHSRSYVHPPPPHHRQTEHSPDDRSRHTRIHTHTHTCTDTPTHIHTRIHSRASTRRCTARSHQSRRSHDQLHTALAGHSSHVRLHRRRAMPTLVLDPLRTRQSIAHATDTATAAHRRHTHRPSSSPPRHRQQKRIGKRKRRKKTQQKKKTVHCARARSRTARPRRSTEAGETPRRRDAAAPPTSPLCIDRPHTQSTRRKRE
jgi:hypothetical protein